MWICKNKGPTCKVHLCFFIELTRELEIAGLLQYAKQKETRRKQKNVSGYYFVVATHSSRRNTSFAFALLLFVFNILFGYCTVEPRVRDLWPRWAQEAANTAIILLIPVILPGPYSNLLTNIYNAMIDKLIILNAMHILNITTTGYASALSQRN